MAARGIKKGNMLKKCLYFWKRKKQIWPCGNLDSGVTFFK